MTSAKAASRDSAPRQALIQATAQVMLEEGYAAATSRRIAAKAGVKPALVHYYFPSMDDLFLAVFRAGGDANLQRQREALTDERPLHTLWQLNSAQASRLLMEFMALANHRKAIRTELAAYAERFRDMEEAALTLVLRTNGIDVEEFPPVVMAMIMGSLARILTMEQSLGITRGHEEAHAFIERFLSRFDLPAS
jgi:AcrR family transcriptional regulator